jgi:hypothetical protein
MKNVLRFTLMSVVCLTMFLSCEPVAKPKPSNKTDLNTIVLKNKSGIPMEFGTLVSVTTTNNWAQLWFVDEHQNIHKVSLSLPDYQLEDTVLVIKRN